MDIIEAARKLGAAIQEDPRFIHYAAAKLANDNDEDLQNKIGQFNVIRMNLDTALSAEDKDEAKVQELNEQLRALYGEIMGSEAMQKYNEAKTVLDAMLNDINSIIMQCVEGADPETVEVHTNCTGSCSTCGGCH